MKKRLFVILLALILCAQLFALTSCDESDRIPEIPEEENTSNVENSPTPNFGTHTPSSGNSNTGNGNSQEMEFESSVVGDFHLSRVNQEDAYYVSKYSGTETDVTVPSTYQGRSVTQIGVSAFEDRTDIRTVVIPDTVTVIEKQALKGCTGLTAITIPKSMTEIGEGAFDQCTSLTIVYYGGTEAEWQQLTAGKGHDALTSATVYYSFSETSPVS